MKTIVQLKGEKPIFGGDGVTEERDGLIITRYVYYNEEPGSESFYSDRFSSWCNEIVRSKIKEKTGYSVFSDDLWMSKELVEQAIEIYLSEKGGGITKRKSSCHGNPNAEEAAEWKQSVFYKIQKREKRVGMTDSL